MADVITSIGQGTSHNSNVNITNVEGTGPWTITLASAYADGVVGDALHDEAASPGKYRITAGANTTSLTVVDSEGAGTPDFSGTSQAQITRYYNGTTPLVDWELDLDDTNVYPNGSADDAVGTCYNDAAFDEDVTIAPSGTPNHNAVRLTVADGERFTGTAGTGARIEWTTAHGNQFIDVRPHKTGADALVVEWLECDGNGQNLRYGVNANAQTAGRVAHIKNLVIHDTQGGDVSGAGVYGPGRDVRVSGTLVYDITSTASNRSRQGIYVDGDRADGGVFGNTVWGGVAHGSGDFDGIWATVDDVDTKVRNNVSGGHSSTSGTVLDFNFAGTTNLTSSNNCSEDASADDGGGSGHVINATVAGLFVSTTAGSEDFNVQDTDSDLHDAGVDLGDVDGKRDLNNRDRNAEGDTWDIGAFEFVAAAGGGDGTDMPWPQIVHIERTRSPGVAY